MFHFLGAFIQSILALFGASFAHVNTSTLPPVSENNVQVVQQSTTNVTAEIDQNSLKSSGGNALLTGNIKGATDALDIQLPREERGRVVRMNDYRD